MRPVSRITILGFRLGIFVLAGYWIALAVGTHLPAGLVPSGSVSDKTKHFWAFAVLTYLILHVTRPGKPPFRYVFVAVCVTVYAALDEWTQGAIPGRVPDVRDFLADISGMCLAIAAYATARGIFRRRQNRQEITAGIR
ncbi:MAG: VanZ family protein [Planctomycetota bacterium]